MRRGVRGCAARATRTLRAFITAVLRLICSIVLGIRSRIFHEREREVSRKSWVGTSFEFHGRVSGDEVCRRDDPVGFSLSEFMAA